MKIAIIGCGYVGTFLAGALSTLDHEVTGTRQTEEGIHEIQNTLHNAVILHSTCYEKLESILADQEVIIVSAGAKSKAEYGCCYLDLAKAIVQHASSSKTVIYTSSTSVYLEKEGKEVDENSPVNIENPEMKLLIEAEKEYLKLQSKGWKVAILRLSEIYGPQRTLEERMIKHQDKKISGSPSGISNMVHVEDVVGAILFAMEKHLEGIYNVSDEDHPLRENLYQAVSTKYGLKPPIWDPHGKALRGNKKVNSKKIQQAGFVFKHPHREF